MSLKLLDSIEFDKNMLKFFLKSIEVRGENDKRELGSEMNLLKLEQL